MLLAYADARLLDEADPDIRQKINPEAPHWSSGRLANPTEEGGHDGLNVQVQCKGRGETYPFCMIEALV